MVTINPNSFATSASNELTNIIEMAEISGHNLIKVSSNKVRSSYKLTYFETLKRPVINGSRGMVGVNPIMVHAPVRMHKDKKSGVCIGLVLDTPHNRVILAKLYRGGTALPVKEEDKIAIKELAIERGIKTTAVKHANQFVNRTVTETRLAKQIENKDVRMLELELELKRAKEDMKKLIEKDEAVEERRAKNQEFEVNTTVTADDGQVEIVKEVVKATPAPAKSTGRGRPAKKK